MQISNNIPILQRSGTTISPIYAGDLLDMGTGNYSGTRLTLTQTTGTSPFTITSTTVNTNLNADLWDGYQFSDYLDQSVKQAASPTFANLYIADNGVIECLGEFTITTEGGLSTFTMGDTAFETMASSTSNTGSIFFTTGNTSASDLDSGFMSFLTGPCEATGNSGWIHLTTGGAIGAGKSSGDISLQIGVATGGATSGNIIIGTFSGLLKGASGVVSAITDNSTNWNLAYSHKTTEDAINGILKIDGAGGYSAAIAGTDYQTGTLTATRIPYATGSPSTLTDDADFTFGSDILHIKGLNLTAGSITDDTGAISFNNENLSGTGYARFDGGLGIGATPTTGIPFNFAFSNTGTSLLGLLETVTSTNNPAIATLGPTVKGLGFTAGWTPSNLVRNQTAGAQLIGSDGVVALSSKAGETYNITVPVAYGYRSYISATVGSGASGSVTITNAYGFYALNNQTANGAVITDSYAFYDAGQTYGANNWGLWTNTPQNYISNGLRTGNTRVGVNTLTGSIDPAASVNVVGVGTLFLTEVAVGDLLIVTGETRQVATITDDTHLTVTSAFSNNANDTSPDVLKAPTVPLDVVGAILSSTTITATTDSIAAYHQTSTAPTAKSTGTVVIVAKDANLLTANAGWMPVKDNTGTIVYIPYWT